MRLSLRRRLLVATTALTLLVVGLMALLVQSVMSHALQSEVDQSLQTTAEALAGRLEVERGRVVFDVDRDSPAVMPADVEVQVFERGGTRVFSSPGVDRGDALGDWLRAHGDADVAQWFDATLPDLPGVSRVVALPATAFTDLSDVSDLSDEADPESAAAKDQASAPRESAPAWVFVARPRASLDHTLAQLRWTLAGAVVMAGLAALLSGHLVSRSATRPIGAVARQIAQLEPGRLQREASAAADAAIPVELDPIVEKIDALLVRVEDELARQHRLTADVAHDLRTPVAGVRTLLDVCLQRDRSGPQYREFVATARSALCSLSSLLDHVLTLARLDARVETALLDPVAIDSVIAEAIAIVQPGAQARDVAIDVTGERGTVIATDAQKLTTILVNLLANAVEYGSAGSRVTVVVEGSTERVAIHVRDAGPGVPPDRRTRIFDRFVRGDGEGARNGGTDGHHGLGLPIALGFARVLGGDLRLAPANGAGSDFVLELPRPLA